ncbi:MAG: hypothetical protein ABIC68_02285 [Candidatus Omnitrophota bacterium]
MGFLKKYLKAIFIPLFLTFVFSSVATAQEVKVVFTGQSYAALYPCNCPFDRVGGLSRRASVISKIRSESKDVIVVEAGSSFGFDEKDLYSQSFDMDRQRTAVYLDSLKLMGYDALLAGPGEFAFGLDFLKKYEDLPFMVSNIKGFESSYVIKDLGYVKVGIIGFCDVIDENELGLKWLAPSAILKETILKLKNRGVDFVILLSGLDPKEDEELLKKIKGIDVVINGTYSLGSVGLKTVEGAVYLKTWWQARSVGVLTLDFKDRKLQDKKLESIILNKDIGDDERVLSLLPRCFQSADCPGVAGSIAECQNRGTKQAQCQYKQAPKAKLMIVQPRICHTCHIDDVIANLNKFFENLEIEYLTEDSKKAKEFIKEFEIKMLPAYILDKDISELKQFDAVKTFLIEGENNYLLKPSDSGVSFLLERPRIPKRLDVFFNLGYNQSPELFQMLKVFQEQHKDYRIFLNFIVVRNKDGQPMSQGGPSEIEEFRRIACIEKMYPDHIFDYLICRSSQKGLSWWGDCALEFKIDSMQVKECVASEYGRVAFDEHIALSEEFQIVNGPTFIVENNEIFSIVNMPSLKEFEQTVIGVTDKKWSKR